MTLRVCAVVIAFAAALASGNPQILLDDMDASLNRNTAMMSQSTCSADAYKGQFHIEDSNQGEGAYFEFKFDVTQHGCYSLEEFHPSINTTCSDRLASSAHLHVDWCKGQQSTLAIDQSRHGGRWNFLGIFPFYIGWEGALRLSSPKGATGLLAVDAFRLTWIGDRCTQGMETQLWREDQARKGGSQAQEDVDRTQWQAGSLRLSVQSDSSVGAAEQLSSLRSMKLVIEGSLKTHFGALAVKVVDIQTLDGRRLAGCRRLQTTGTFFEVSFRALVSSAKAVSPDLVSELSDALAGAGAKIRVESAEVSWLQPENSTPKNDDVLLPITIVVAVVLLVVGAGAVFLRFFLRLRRANTCDESSSTAKAQQDVEAAKEVADTKDVKTEEVDDTASTITPQSDRTE